MNIRHRFNLHVSSVLLYSVLVVVGYQYGTIDTYRILVTGKERVSTGSGHKMNHKYLIYTDHETFENTDAFFHLKFNSSDVYDRLETGKRYRVNVYGWRIPFFSMYKNIISFREVQG